MIVVFVHIILQAEVCSKVAMGPAVLLVLTVRVRSG